MHLIGVCVECLMLIVFSAAQPRSFTEIIYKICICEFFFCKICLLREFGWRSTVSSFSQSTTK